MAKYRKKPVVIDAVLWTGREADMPDVMALVDFALLPKDDVHVDSGIGYTPTTGELYIPTLEGTMTARPGDYIIRGVKGELYPCKPDIFKETNEPVEAGATIPDNELREIHVLYEIRKLVEPVPGKLMQSELVEAIRRIIAERDAARVKLTTAAECEAAERDASGSCMCRQRRSDNEKMHP